jgi:hypothetical protein
VYEVITSRSSSPAPSDQGPDSPKDVEDKPPEDERFPTVDILHKLQDPIQRSPWNGVAFSGDGEYVLAGAFI